MAGGEDSLDTVVSLIQILWESEHKNWEKNVADIEVCMLYKGIGPRNLAQNQRFIMLISFHLVGEWLPELSQKGLRFMLKTICLSFKNNTGSDRSTQFWVLSWYLRHVLKTRSRSSSILNMIPLPVFLQTLPRHTRVFQKKMRRTQAFEHHQRSHGTCQISCQKQWGVMMTNGFT